MTTKQAAPAAGSPPARVIPAAESRFQASADYVSPLTSYTPEAGTALEQLLAPEYWANIKQLKPGVRIWCVPDDERWYAELLVRQTGQGFAKVVLLRQGELDAIEIDPKISADFDIEWRGAKIKHRVVRKLDKQVLKEGLDTVEAAQAWIRDHARAVAA